MRKAISALQGIPRFIEETRTLTVDSDTEAAALKDAGGTQVTQS